MSVKWTEYKGKRILMCDYRGLGSEELAEDISTAAKMLLEVPAPTKSLIFNNFEGAVVGKDVMTRLKEVGPEVEPRTEKSAIIGIHGVRHVLLSAYNRVTGAANHQKLFDTQEEALEWLVSDD